MHPCDPATSEPRIHPVPSSDAYYPAKTKIRLILDSTPPISRRKLDLFWQPVPIVLSSSSSHGSWLNLIESFFAKMAKIFLRGLQVSSKKELQQRLEQYLEEINETPVVFRWKYGLEPLSKI